MAKEERNYKENASITPTYFAWFLKCNYVTKALFQTKLYI